MRDGGPAGVPELVGAAQRVLAEAWDHPVRLRIQDEIRSWGRHTLLRCRVKQDPDGAADFVVVKAVNQAGGRVSAERAGLALLAELPAVRALVPRLYAADPDDTMLVLENLDDGPTLGQLLRARASWAEDALLASMRGLAAVHASTRGGQPRYAELRARADRGHRPGPAGSGCSRRWTRSSTPPTSSTSCRGPGTCAASSGTGWPLPGRTRSRHCRSTRSSKTSDPARLTGRPRCASGRPPAVSWSAAPV